MGRKIPGKKHRGIKDPEKQRAERWNQLKDKVNAPPSTLDEQSIPKSLLRVMQLKEAVKSGKIGGKKKHKNTKIKNTLITIGRQNNVALHPAAKPEQVVPTFSQKPGEKTYNFWNRVCRETETFINETKYEKKYGVSIKRNNETGEMEGIEKKQKSEIDELKMKHKNIGKKKKTIKSGELEPKLSKSQKRKRKLEAKKANKIQNDIDEFKNYKETVKFGEVAHAPPEFKIRPNKADTTITKPAKKDLLLHSLLETKREAIRDGKSVGTIKTGKRKNLPSAERRILEKQQSDIVTAYRLLKSQNHLKQK